MSVWPVIAIVCACFHMHSSDILSIDLLYSQREKTKFCLCLVLELGCASNPCQHNGTCTLPSPPAYGYTCTCPTGYTGQNCGIVPFCLLWWWTQHINGGSTNMTSWTIQAEPKPHSWFEHITPWQAKKMLPVKWIFHSTAKVSAASFKASSDDHENKSFFFVF